MLEPNDVIFGFRMVLGRDPESQATIEAHRNFPTLQDLGLALIRSEEFQDKAKKHPASCSTTAEHGEPKFEHNSVTDEAVVWCYRLFLGRDPESKHVIQIHRQAPNLQSLREAFLRSDEFANVASSLTRSGLPQQLPLPLDVPPIDVEVSASAEQMAALWRHVEASWVHLGEEAPHYSVVTNPKFLPAQFQDNEEEFWISGELELQQLNRLLARHGFHNLSKKSCVEYGCGVGRFTTALASCFMKVDAFDISASHLAIAETRARELERANIVFHSVAEEVLSALPACDFFYSRLVLQHNPPPIICQLIATALAALNPRGVAMFQVPVYMKGYRFVVQEYLEETKDQLRMEMHCLPQDHIYRLISERGCALLDVREIDDTGRRDVWISNTFLVRKDT